MKIKISYASNSVLAQSDIQETKNICLKYGQTNEYVWGMRAGAIDIVTILEIGITWVALESLKEYLKGFFEIENYKELGRTTRKELKKELTYFKYFLIEYYKTFVISHKKRYGAITIVDHITSMTPIYVVLNTEKMNEKIIKKLPKAYLKTLKIINMLDKDKFKLIIAQLYPSYSTNSWKYLFIPTFENDGRFIERYIDLKDGKIYYIKSAEEFLKKFDITSSDQYKILLSPIAGDNFKNL